MSERLAFKSAGAVRKNRLAPDLYDRIPANLNAAQHGRTVRELNRMACMMVHWFADRAFTCPNSLDGTIETYKGLVIANCHNAA